MTTAVLLAAACLLQLLLATALRLLPVVTVTCIVAWCRPATRLGVRAAEQRVVWAIEAAGRRLGASCLVRALAADLLLAAGDVRIGIRRGPTGQLESHAWFERDGRVLVGGAESKEYEPFTTLRSMISTRT